MKNLKPDNIDNERLNQAIQVLRKGMAGNATAVLEANRLFEQLRLDYPKSALLVAYHGSTMLLIARDKTKTMERLKWSNNGLKLLDKAVAAAPQDGMIRLIRGKAIYKLPEKYFRRTQTVIEDYTFLINQETRQDEILDSENYSQLVYELGEAHYRIGRNQDAELIWRKLENQTLNPEMQQLLRENLQSLEGKPAVVDKSNNNLTSKLIGASLAVGIALQSWVKHEKKKERAALRKRRLRKKRRR